jgi:hypothetical protein
MNFILLAFKEIKSSIKMSNNVEQKIYLCPICKDKKYKHFPSMSRHKKTCGQKTIKNEKIIKEKTIKKVKAIEEPIKDHVETPVIIVIDDKDESEFNPTRKELDNLWITITKEREDRINDKQKVKNYLAKVRKDHLFQEVKMKQQVDRLISQNKQLMIALQLLSQSDAIDTIVHDEVFIDTIVHDEVVIDTIVTIVQDEVVFDTIVQDEVVFDTIVDEVFCDTIVQDEVVFDTIVDIPYMHVAISDGEIKLSYDPIIIFEEGSKSDLNVAQPIDFYEDILEFRKSFYNKKTLEFNNEKAELFVNTYINQLKTQGISFQECISKLAVCYPISLLSLKTIFNILFSVYRDSYRYVDIGDFKDPWSFYDHNFILKNRMCEISKTIALVFELGFISIFKTIYKTLIIDISCVHIPTIESNKDLHNLLLNIRQMSNHIYFVQLIQESIIQFSSVNGFDPLLPYNFKTDCVIDRKDYSLLSESFDMDEIFQRSMKSLFETFDYSDIEEQIDKLLG